MADSTSDAAGTAPGLFIDAMTGGGSAMAWAAGPAGYVVTVGKSVDWLSRNAEALKSHIASPAGQ